MEKAVDHLPTPEGQSNILTPPKAMISSMLIYELIPHDRYGSQTLIAVWKPEEAKAFAEENGYQAPELRTDLKYCGPWSEDLIELL